MAREGPFQADTQLGRGYGMYTVKPVFKWPFKNRQNKDLNDNL